MSYELLGIIIRLQMPFKRFLSSHIKKYSFHVGTLPLNDVRRMLMQLYDALLTYVKGCFHECFNERAQ